MSRRLRVSWSVTLTPAHVIGLVIVACFSKFGGPVAARILGAAISFAYFCYFLIAINPYYSHKFGLDCLPQAPIW
jgi:hypothetical protein